MAHKYDAAKAKKRRILYWLLLFAGAIGFNLTPTLIAPATPLVECLLFFAQFVFMLDVIFAAVGILATAIAEL